MAVIRSRRVRDAGMGGLVQQPAALGAHRQHPAGRSRGTLLRHAGTTCHGGVTQTKWPPTNPGRFSVSFPDLLSGELQSWLHMTAEQLAAWMICASAATRPQQVRLATSSTGSN